MKGRTVARLVCLLVALCCVGCPSSKEKGDATSTDVLKQYPLDDMTGIITTSGVDVDKTVSSDGNGSLRIKAEEPVIIRLFETGDVDVENARLIYRARLKTENVDGKAYLEMYCRFPGKGEFFSRGLQSPLTGTNEWTTEEIPFFLKEGQNPDNVKLNVVVNGTGTVWVDDVQLLKAPL